MSTSYTSDGIPNFGIFSPKAQNYRRLNLNKAQKNTTSYTTYSRCSNTALFSPINLYTKNISNNNNFFSSEHNNIIPQLISPIHKNKNILHKSSFKKEIKSLPLTSGRGAKKELSSVMNYSFIKSPINKNNKVNNLYKNYIYSNKIFNNSSKQNYYNLESEKLYQETYQYKKLVKFLSNELVLLKKENVERDRQITLKEKEINNIILNNKESSSANEFFNNSFVSNTNIKNNDNNEENEESFNFNDSIYINALLGNKSISANNLFSKIKKEIKQANNELKIESLKLQRLKSSIFVTSMNELNIESKMLEEQFTKINSLLQNSILVKEGNEKKLEEFNIIKDNIDKQEKIINNLNEMISKLEVQESVLNEQFTKNKEALKVKLNEVNQNNSKLSLLKKKNDNLINDVMIHRPSTAKVDGNPMIINIFYKNKINNLKKNIKYYSSQVKLSDVEINKLKEKRQKLLGSEKMKELKIIPGLLDKNPKNEKDKENKEQNNLSQKYPSNDLVLKLKEKYKDSKEKIKDIKERAILYQNKLKEIRPEKQSNDENQSQIEFGIDNTNPFYSDKEDNNPEKSNKFTGAQFNQFTYILFKNFESKGIILEESIKKVINPFIQEINKNESQEIEYPSAKFDLIVEEFTKIILNALNGDNSYNHTLTKIFINALLYNSECNFQKFIEYFKILFSYTRNYSSEEAKYINKLKSKYRDQTKKLIKSINYYIIKELNSSQYFPLLKIKELFDKNEINLKDKYIEFLFYYMKKFDDPKSKLSDLKFCLLYNIIPLSEIDSNDMENEELDEGYPQELKKSSKIDLTMEENKNKKNIEEKKEKEEINVLDLLNKSNKSIIKNKVNTENNKDNSDDYEEEEDSMTEITSEEYVKQLTEALSQMSKGLNLAKLTFSKLMENVIQKRKITGVFYDCITIEDFNDQLKSINVVLADLKLSCLCSKYSIPNELRLIDKNKIEKDIDNYAKGTLKFKEEEEDM